MRSFFSAIVLLSFLAVLTLVMFKPNKQGNSMHDGLIWYIQSLSAKPLVDTSKVIAD